MKKYYLYLLKSLKDGSKYIGQTSNITSRLKKHNSGQVQSTKHKLPWILVKSEEYPDRNKARYREYLLKHNTYLRKRFYGE